MDNALTILVSAICAAAAKSLICSTCLAYCAFLGNLPALYVPKTLTSHSISFYREKILTKLIVAVRVVS